MEVDLRELRQVFEQLLQLWEQGAETTISIPADFYWHIPKELKYNVYEEPHDLTIGQLTDDWEELKGVLNGERPPVRYAMVWLAAVLRAVGEFGCEQD